jgi:hypothetical protein
MVALTCEALIRYYESSAADPEKKKLILSRIKETAAYMFEEAWMPKAGAFYYESTAKQAAADLNLLICPAYAWVWHRTGDKSFLDMGDKLFYGGVAGAWLDGGKQFSQNYRWSFDFVKWMSEKPDKNEEGQEFEGVMDPNSFVINVLGAKRDMNKNIVKLMFSMQLKADDVLTCYAAAKATGKKLDDIAKARLGTSSNFELLNSALKLDKDTIKAVNDEVKTLKKEIDEAKIKKEKESKNKKQ